ncbi:hypothetical protein AB0B45_49930 [Nonomuraea sp. NPDC049152]|uniref:hypothetical protein n=1 Tax=Nonomuraea sp. NPDC049152 TaxID=3154350 RepID=UPI003407F7D4
MSEANACGRGRGGDGLPREPWPLHPRLVHVAVAVRHVGDLAELPQTGGRAPITVPLHHEPWGEWVLQLTDPNGVVVQLVEWISPTQG